MQHLLLGDRNEVRITRSCTINGERYLPFDELIVGKETARQLLEENVCELVSLEFDKGMKMHGQSVRFHRK